MVNAKHLIKIVNKIAKLKDIYLPFLYENEYELNSTFFETQESYDKPPIGKTFLPISKGQTWGGNFMYGWFKIEFTLPKNLKNKEVFLLCQNGGVENLVFIGDNLVGMFDDVQNGKDSIFRRHKYLSILNEDQSMQDNQHTFYVEAYASHTFYGTMPYEQKQTFSINGYREKPCYDKICLFSKNQTIQKFIDNLSILNSLIRGLSDSDYLKYAIYNLYEQVFKIVSLMPSEGYDLCDIQSANNLLDSFMDSVCDKTQKTDYEIGLVGLSHLDTAWLWTMTETHKKSARTLANATKLMDKYPDYKFITSSMLHLSWLETEYPTLFEKVKQCYNRGQLEINGCTWVECDCNLVGGEMLIWQFVRGQRYKKQKFGDLSDIFFLPDTFGYSSSLPQIILGCGGKYFITTKLSWNDTNTFPYQTFNWQGLDGSRVLTHFANLQAEALPEEIISRHNMLMNKHLENKALICYGFGDGGGGADENMVRLAIKTQNLAGNFPKTKHTTASEFMQDLSKTKHPTFEGELYLELHRGTLTSSANFKRYNRKLEIAIHTANYLSVSSNSKAYTKDILKVTDNVLLNCFHDILPGSSIKEANMQAEKIYEQSTIEINNITNKLKGDIKTKTLLNPSPFARGGEPFYVQGDMNCEISQQFVDLNGNKVTAVVSDIMSYSHATNKQFIISSVQYSGNTIETELLRLTLDERMFITSIFDKEEQRQVLNGKANEFMLSENVPNLWDNWDIDPDYYLKQKSIAMLISSEIVSNGKVELRIRNTYLIGNSQLVQDMVISPYTKLIRFDTKLNWCEKHKLLKVNFGTNIHASTFKTETQFGFNEHQTHQNTSLEQAKFEVASHKWCDLSEGNYGVSIINDCKYGVSCKGGNISLSLMMSGTHPDPTADNGVKYFSYAIYPHNHSFNSDIVKTAYNFNIGVEVISSQTNGCVSPKIDKQNVVLETIKWGEDDSVIFRIYECERSRTNFVLDLGQKYTLIETDMLENQINQIGTNSQFKLSIAPFEIKTYKLIKVNNE